jgi:sugar lactone lactonase YvrE
MTRSTTVLWQDLRFPEGARWHDNLLWFSDMHTGEVFRADPATGSLMTVVRIDDQPSGLGWLPDESLVISAMLSRKIFRLDRAGDLAVYADMSGLTTAPTNDLTVDDDGHIFVGGFGYDLYGGLPQQPGPIFRVSRDGSVTTVASDMVFPNGCVILPGTRTLVFAETWAARLTAFEIDGDGALTQKRIWAPLPAGSTPDGLCVDDQGSVWVSSIATSTFLRVEEGGTVTDTIELEPGRCATDCALDGTGQTLYLLTSNSWQPSDTTSKQGRIEAVTLSRR